MLISVVLFSTFVTLVSTVLQLYLDYRRDIDVIENHFDEIDRGSLGVIATSLWNVDIDQLQTILDGLLRLPDMQALEVTETGEYTSNLSVKAGSKQKKAALFRDYPIFYTSEGVARRIGTLHAEATFSGVYQRLIDAAVVILVSQAIKIFLVALFIVLIFYQMVGRHLSTISQWLSRYDLTEQRPVLALPGKPRTPPDELDGLVFSLNDMTNRLLGAYRALTDANAQMERDIVARFHAEREVVRLNAILEQRVKQRTFELEAANEELAAFAYSVSHDLRAPLRRIEGFGQILVQEHAEHLDEQAVHYLDRMCAGAKDMADMIDSFLKLSRSTRGELAIETLDLSAMAAETVHRLREKTPDREIDVVIEPGLTVEGDRRLLGVVLENLFENAWKYTRKAAHPSITFGADQQDGKVRFHLRDNGTGFDMAHAKRLFSPFVRLHRPEDFEGTGVGLATVQRIIVRHGGRVWADAQVGVGATFYFTCWEKGTNDGQQ
ncbi:ATP-binding protein [Telmatospirillum sp.]|uniref:sensor histidine kinase n=1 Tax=Telmatospirillum sp. TaxID=2079197 RepID=UPI00283E7C6A|nr:ATP-binding protein [Telmatospirillum sp.]MDR3437461.1 ATP-binding protein [Telmatospirillum sp.]